MLRGDHPATQRLEQKKARCLHRAFPFAASARDSNRNSIRFYAAQPIAAWTIRERKSDAALGMRAHRFAGSAAGLAEFSDHHRFGFLQNHVRRSIILADEVRERDRGAVGHGERKPERDAVAFSLARAFSRIRVTDFLNGPKKSQKFPELHTGSRDGSSAHAAPISFDRRCHVFRRKFYRSSSGQERWWIVCSERTNRIALVQRSEARTEVDAVRTSVTIVIFAAVFQPLDSTGTFQVLPARKIQPFLRPRIQKKDPPWPIRSTKPPFPS